MGIQRIHFQSDVAGGVFYDGYTTLISTTSNGPWFAVPAPIEFKPNWETLDSATTGRDNNTGLMFRDKVADKRKWECTLPDNLTNTSWIYNNECYSRQFVKPASRNGYYMVTSTSPFSATPLTQAEYNAWNTNLHTYAHNDGMLITGVPQLLSIVKQSDFYLKTLDTISGTFSVSNVYCSSCEPEVNQVIVWSTANSSQPYHYPVMWTYKSFSINFIEM